MERVREPVLIVGHQGILRILYAYFMGLSRAEAPFVSIPLNHVLQLSPHAYGCDETRISLMNKEEMAKFSGNSDGQDEPITSMPVKMGTGVLRSATPPVSTPQTGRLSRQGSMGEEKVRSVGKQTFSRKDVNFEGVVIQIDDDDKELNVPSC